jgi:predicted unusual protein kinase regulating ubiquinone biosynthesis (AarF/ABC1/UbiB family)
MTDQRTAPELKRISASRLARGWAATGPMLSIGRHAVQEAVRRARSATPSKSGEAERRLAESTVSALGQLKGLMMKAGQVASFMNLDLPAETRRVLATLQDRSVAMPAETIEAVIERELGAPPSELFAEWEREPLAAASLGQVHRARHRDGRELAVKVQYPGVEQALDSDLKNAEMMNVFGGLLLRGLDRRAAMSELRDRLLEECDYRKEARNQQDFRAIYSSRPGFVIPAVVSELSSSRVLVSEFFPGERFQAFAERAKEEERNRAGQQMLLFAYESILTHDMFNCDPHPGNYLFGDDQVAFLDFGCVKRFPPGVVDVWRRMLRAVVERDLPSFTNSVVDLGIARRGCDFDFEYQFKIAEYLSLPWLEDKPFKFTNDYLKGSFSVLMFDNPMLSKMNVPRDLLFLNRLQWGLYAVLCALGAEANWHRSMTPLIYPSAPPAAQPSTSAAARFESAVRRAE